MRVEAMTGELHYTLAMRQNDASNASRERLEKKGKRKKALKVFAGAALLIAFGIQNWFLKATTDWLALQEAAQRNYMSAYAASLSYANLYFTSGQATQVFNGELLRKAAQENAAGIGGAIAAADRDKEEVKNTVRELFRHVDAVHDLDSYNEYLGYVNTLEAKGLQKPGSEMDTLSNRYYWTYFCFYCLGSGLALLSIFYE